MVGPAKLFDPNCLPLGALIALVLGVVGAFLAHGSRGPVHARLAAAWMHEPEEHGSSGSKAWSTAAYIDSKKHVKLFEGFEDSARSRELLVALELRAIMALDALAFVSILLARRGWNLPPRRRLRCLARPWLLNVEWLLACATFAAQVALLAIYSCLLQLFRVLDALCVAENGTCAGAIGEEMQAEFPGLDSKRFCQYDLRGSDPVVLFVSGCLMTVIGQGLMASSLAAEWERVSEELHYQGHGTEPLASNGEAAEPDSSEE